MSLSKWSAMIRKAIIVGIAIVVAVVVAVSGREIMEPNS
jgi:hypothetical protein